VVLSIALAAALTRSTGLGSLVTLGVLLIFALIVARFGIEGPWGLEDPWLRVALVLGLGLIIGPTHWRDARQRLNALSPR
jgi:hypothetical protein